MVKIRQGFEEKSRLGLLLINRGYLSEPQLQAGLRLQRDSGQRLGEVLVQAGWISDRELLRVLKHQSRYRNAAAFFAMVTLPFQPLVSFAASNGSGVQSGEVQQAGQHHTLNGLSALNDSELAAITGQAQETYPAERADVIDGMKLTAHIFVPVLNFLESELTVTGVHYRDDSPRHGVRGDGAVILAFPERIEQIRMDNIRVSGGQTPAIGNVSIHDIRFHPDSQMTLYTR